MGAAEHTGKLVLDVPHTGHSSVVVPPEQARVFRRDGAYIITGGLGGLGLFLAEKMAEAGCGRIVLNSRSQPTPEAQETIERIRATGADIEVECGDIAEPETADRAGGGGDRHRASGARRAARGGGGRGRHADQHHRRAHRPRLGAEGLRRVELAPGHGHPATGLVLLVLLGGRPGGLARSGRVRRGQQLAGRLHPLAPSPGPSGHRDRVGGMGRDRPRQALAEGADIAITPDEGAYAFEALLRHDRAYTGYAPMTGTPWLTAFAQRSRFAEAFQAVGQSGTDTSEFRAELNALPRDEWPTRLRRLVSDQISLILRRTIDPDRPLSEYGLDSLGNLELRTRIETETGIRITSTDITTVRELAAHLCDKLAGQEAASETS